MQRLGRAVPSGVGASASWTEGHSVELRRIGVLRNLAALPIAEDIQKPITGFGFQRLRRKSTESPHRLAHLLEVRAAPGALREMCFKPHSRAMRQPVLEIVRDQLYKLLAREVVSVGHGGLE